MSDELVALLAGQPVGRVRKDRKGRLSFIYEEDWRQARGAYPLSLSMPLTAATHDARRIEAYLWGLLPDNEFILARWAKRFQVSARNVFALISYVGEDCAGAVQFARPDRLDVLLREGPGKVEWLSESDVAERIRTLRVDQSAWRIARDTGQFSLAGAQPKTALLFDGDRWGVPSGRMPTTHILKPSTGQFHGYAENEHICLALARAAGLPAADSRIVRFEDQTTIVVERYDRVRTGAPAAASAAMSKQAEAGPFLRVHQEDMCQALGRMPTEKYQNEGGPGASDVVGLLRTHSGDPQEDVETFVDALAFNWLIGGSDAHAKNYSLLIGGGGRVRLAPLYDLVSILPYPETDVQKVKLSMKIGGKYRLRDIGAPQWRILGRDLRLDEDATVTRIERMMEKLPDAASEVAARALEGGLDRPIVDHLVDAIAERAGSCLREFRRPAAR
jgi:serine/threonine-protein kinase HipA